MQTVVLLLKAIVIAIVEGITEFLPISSTGHMILVGQFIHFTGDFANLFEVVIQFGAILAVVVLYRQKILRSLHRLRPGEFGFRLWLAVILALIPSVIVAKLFYKKAEKLFMHPVPVAWAMVVGGILLLVLENIYRRNRRTAKAEDVRPVQALTIGLFQCISFLWPGFSRSASTIMGGWVMGLTTAAATEFTFFLAIPTMFGATVYSLMDTSVKISGLDGVVLVIGFIVAFVVALLVVKSFLEYLKKKPLRVFGIYRIVVGVLLLVLGAAKVIQM